MQSGPPSPKKHFVAPVTELHTFYNTSIKEEYQEGGLALIFFNCTTKINLVLGTICYPELSELLSKGLSHRGIQHAYYKSSLRQAATPLT